MKLILTGILAGFLAATAAHADEMVFTSWGGTTQEAQTKSWAAPFEASSGIKVLQDGPTDYGKLKAMVEGGSVAWDVVDVEMDFAIKAAKDGLLEPIDFNVVPKADLDPRFTTEHAVGSFYYSFVLAWNKGAVSGEPAG
jgi:putative spermidine/putrescine transport system substrate-binding protein